jgi:hypothetical protein
VDAIAPACDAFWALHINCTVFAGIVHWQIRVGSNRHKPGHISQRTDHDGKLQKVSNSGAGRLEVATLRGCIEECRSPTGENMEGSGLTYQNNLSNIVAVFFLLGRQSIELRSKVRQQHTASRVDPRRPRSPTNFVVVQHATHRETSGGLRPASSNFAKLQTQTNEPGRDLCIHAPVNNLGLLLEQKRHPREQHLRACFTAREAARRRSKAEQGPHLWGVYKY